MNRTQRWNVYIVDIYSCYVNRSTDQSV